MRLVLGGIVIDTSLTSITLEFTKADIANISSLADRDPGKYYYSGPAHEEGHDTSRAIFEAHKKALKKFDAAYEEAFNTDVKSIKDYAEIVYNSGEAQDGGSE